MRNSIIFFLLLITLSSNSQTSPLSFGPGAIKANGNCQTVSVKIQVPPTQYKLQGGRDELIWRDQFGLHVYTLATWEGGWFGNATYTLPSAQDAIVQWAAVRRWYWWGPNSFGTVIKSTVPSGIKWCN